MALRKAPRAHPWRGASSVFCLTLGGAFACGPSLTSVHEGTVRFEHCNRLDLDEHIAKNDCSQCWSSWLNEYTYGQPRDRIDYARKRARSLANGDQRPVLKFDERSPDERQFYLVVPGPTSVHAPPPPIATVWKDGDGDAGALAKTTSDRPPADSCADECRTTWKGCGASCANGNVRAERGDESTVAPSAGNHGAEKTNGSKASSSPSGASGCSAKCGNDYSNCMKHCFE